MTTLIAIVVATFAVISSAKNAQVCPAGESYMPEFATTSVVFKGGCVTPEARVRINRVFERFFCLTSSHAYQKGDDSFRRTNTWDDVTGCTSMDVCVVKGRLIPLTKGLFGGECPLVKTYFGGGQ